MHHYTMQYATTQHGDAGLGLGLAPHLVPSAPGAIGANSADEIAHHQVPIARCAIGANND